MDGQIKLGGEKTESVPFSEKKMMVLVKCCCSNNYYYSYHFYFHFSSGNLSNVSFGVT